jgi:carbon-monoxide dehydrogenase medium subunit
MMLPKIDFFEPSTLEDAISLLIEHGTEVKIFAGGTDILPMLRRKELRPKYLISIMEILELDRVSMEPELRIGSTTRIRTIEKDAMIRKNYPILGDAVDNFASIQIRNIATVGGNLCNGAPSADMATPLICLDAIAKIKGPDRERAIPLDDFFVAPGKTILEQGEILSEIVVPKIDRNTGGAYIKLMRRRAMDLPILGISVQIWLDQDLSYCKKARIAMGVVGPVPIRAKKAENILQDVQIGEEIIEEAACAAIQEAQPRTSFRSTFEYRKDMIGVLFKRAVKLSLHRATNDGAGL